MTVEPFKDGFAVFGTVAGERQVLSRFLTEDAANEFVRARQGPARRTRKQQYSEEA